MKNKPVLKTHSAEDADSSQIFDTDHLAMDDDWENYIPTKADTSTQRQLAARRRLEILREERELKALIEDLF